MEYVSGALDIRDASDLMNCLRQYLPRDGVATPSQIINAVQEGMSENPLLHVQVVIASLTSEL